MATGIGAVFIGGVFFVVITALGLRSWLAYSGAEKPEVHFVVGIGLFLTFIGLMATGIIAKSSAAGVPWKLGDITSLPVLLS
jgi:AGZA family xanthine/uracil permease-like MFS transporter